MTPKILSIIIEGRKQRIKEKIEYDNYISYIQGAYFADALKATVGNMFKKKGTDPIKYFEEPLPIFEERKELTEEEKLSEEKKLLLMLESMQFAFESNHK